MDPTQYDLNEDDITGVDWASSSTSAPSNIEGMTVPLMIMSMTGHYFERPDEIIFQHAATADKQLAFVEGASHNLTTCAACEQYPGQYGDTVKTTFDYVSDWLHRRFDPSQR